MELRLLLALVFVGIAGAGQGARQESRPGGPASAPAAEKVFSGPQAGEKALSFQLADVTGGRKEREFDPTKESADDPTLYFFFPADVNRIIARALVTISAACEQGKQHGLRSYFVGLTQSPLTADQRLRDVWSSLKPVVPASLSMEGIEGPGNWALNKKCYVTVVLVKNGKVAFNYAALSPADSDYELLRLELSKLLGVKIDAKPPGFDRGGMMGGGEGRGGRPDARPAREGSEPASRRAGDGKPAESRPKEKPKEERGAENQRKDR